MLTITLIQSTLHWENVEANLKMFQEKIESITKHSHIIILPEMFNTGFSTQSTHLAETMDGKTVEWMKTMAIKNKSIITGSLMIKDAGHVYNRLLWVLPNGEHYQYDKVGTGMPAASWTLMVTNEMSSPSARRLVRSADRRRLAGTPAVLISWRQTTRPLMRPSAHRVPGASGTCQYRCGQEAPDCRKCGIPGSSSPLKYRSTVSQLL